MDSRTDRADMTAALRGVTKPAPMHGGLTDKQRRTFFRLQRELRDAATNCFMRLNDTNRQSWRARALAAQKMAASAQEIYRLLRKP